jgi:hypothetical protein
LRLAAPITYRRATDKTSLISRAQPSPSQLARKSPICYFVCNGWGSLRAASATRTATPFAELT